MQNSYKALFIDKKRTVKEAMRQMDKTAKKILFVADNRDILLGTITDGDIRRWILAGGDLNKKIIKIYNREPVYIKKDASKREIRRIVLKIGSSGFPVVDEKMRVVNVIFWKELIKNDILEEKRTSGLRIPIVIMAGGEGSRLDPFTKILPKALIPIDDKPAAEIIIENFLDDVTGKIYFILGYKGDMIKSYFKNIETKYDIKYISEGKKKYGTAGGLRLLPRNISGTFFLSNCDTLIEADYNEIYSFHRNNHYDITMVSSMQHFIVPYGVISINSGGELKHIKEKPEYDFLVNTGMYVVEKRLLRLIPARKNFHMTDLLRKVKKNGGKIGVYPVSEKSWLDIGQWESYREATKRLLAKL